MGKIRIETDVFGEEIAEEIGDKIEKGIAESVRERNAQSLGQKIKAAAREHIRRHGRVWTTELLNSFEIESEETSGNAVLVVRNEAGHAAAIDTGAEYGDEGPPLHKLIPWVQSKMRGYRVSGGNLVKYAHDDGGKTIITDGGRPMGVTESLPPDLDIDTVQKLEDAGLEGGANRKRAYYITFESGETAYFEAFQETDRPSGSEKGAARNELLFTRLAAENDWRLGPQNRAGTIINPDDGEIIEGNFQRWVDDSDPLGNVIEGPFTPEGYDIEYTPHGFVNENREWLARTTAIDILIGNSDRHAKNIMIDGDGIPHAIDNGGNVFPTGDTLDGLIKFNSIPTAISNLKYFDEFPELEDAMSAMFARQSEYLRELLENHSEDILQHTRQIHGEDSELYRRMERLLTYHTDEIIDHVEGLQQDFLDTHTQSLEDIDQALEEADDIDDIGDNDILDDLGDL